MNVAIYKNFSVLSFPILLILKSTLLTQVFNPLPLWLLINLDYFLPSCFVLSVLTFSFSPFHAFLWIDWTFPLLQSFPSLEFKDYF